MCRARHGHRGFIYRANSDIPQDGKIVEMTVKIADVISTDAIFPLAAKTIPLTNLFSVVPKVDDFVYSMKINILHKLIPGLDKVGYEPGAAAEAPASTSTGAASSGIPAGRRPYQPPFYGDIPRPTFPGRPSLFDEPYGPDDPSRYVSNVQNTTRSRRQRLQSILDWTHGSGSHGCHATTAVISHISY
jgi:hypothetical protein